MNIEKLDTLLQNKLQRVESEVHENELGAIFNKMGMKEKKHNILPFIWSFVVLVILGGLVTFDLLNKEAGTKITDNLNNKNQVQEFNSGQESDKSLAQNTEQTKGYNDHQSKETKVPAEKNYGQDQILETTSSSNFDIHSDDNQNEKTDNTSGQHLGLELLSLTDESIEPFEYRNSSIINYSPFRVLWPTQKDTNSKIEFSNKQGQAESGSLKTKMGVWRKFAEHSKPEIGLWMAPNISFESRNITDENKTKVHEDYQSLADQFEKPLFAINTGLNIRFKVLPFLNLSTGIGLFKAGNTYQYDYRINKIPVVDSATQRILAYIYKPDSVSQHVKSGGRHVSTYIELPLRFQIDLYKANKFRIGLEPAYTLQLFNSSKGEYMDPVSLQLNTSRSVKLRSGNMQLGIPVEIDLNNFFVLSLTPYYGKSMAQVSILAFETKTRVYSGLRLGLYYKIYQTNPNIQ